MVKCVAVFNNFFHKFLPVFELTAERRHSNRNKILTQTAERGPMYPIGSDTLPATVFYWIPCKLRGAYFQLGSNMMYKNCVESCLMLWKASSKTPIRSVVRRTFPTHDKILVQQVLGWPSLHLITGTSLSDVLFVSVYMA